MKTFRLNRYAISIIVLCFTCSIAALNLTAQEIHKVVAAGDLKKVQELIKSNPSNLNSKNENGNTPLHNACSSGQIEIAKYLIDINTDINNKNNNGYTPLLRACGGNKT